MSVIVIIISLVLTIIGVVVFLFGFKRLHKYRIIADTPTSKIRSMAMGLVEIHGNVSGKQFIKSPFSQSECVFYKYRIEEYRKHTSTDSKGRTSTRYSWDTIASGERRVPFFAKDDTGEVYVKPWDAEISAPLKKAFYQRRGLFGAIGLIINALRDWDNDNTSDMDVSGWALEPIDPYHHSRWGASVGDRKYFEYYLEPNENLYLIGTAANSRDAPNNVFIKKGENEPTFIISYKSEKDVLSSLKWQVIGLLIFGSIFIVIGITLAIVFGI